MFEKYNDLYMKNMVTIHLLNMLKEAGKLTKEQVEAIVNERLSKFGY